MKPFRYFQPTDIRFGHGQIDNLGRLVAPYGRRALLVTTPGTPAMAPVYNRVTGLLTEAGVEVAHFDGVQPNPTTATVSAGAEIARSFGATVVVGLGGGSSMDTAKAIAVEATHEGTAWDYLFFKRPQPDSRTLPIVAISTTSGTGSQVTQVAVVTNTADRNKSALYNDILYPRLSIVDPQLMVTVPEHVTASTGFDAFAHSFESSLHPNASPMTDLMALEAMTTLVRYLPIALERPEDLEARTRLAWADTLAGLCIAAAGVTLPHGIAMAIGGMYPHVMHGEALAVVYPAVLRYSWRAAVPRFARLGRLLDPAMAAVPDAEAAERACKALTAFLDRIGMRLNLKQFGVPRGELDQLAKQSRVLPDYTNHPRVATDVEILALLQESYEPA
jgi:alcohol dehydrogenase class IV